MNFAELERELKTKKELQTAIGSEEGRKLMEKLDGDALRKAAKSGDADALKAILSQVLSSPEGRALAENVQKAMGK